MSEPSRPWRRAILAGAAALAPGCSLVPGSRLDDCAKLNRGLQAEVAQLTDASLKLRADNEDLTRRALDDARRIEALDEANRRLERSVLGYQAERDRLVSAFERFTAQLHAAADPPPTAEADERPPAMAARPEPTPSGAAPAADEDPETPR